MIIDRPTEVLDPLQRLNPAEIMRLVKNQYLNAIDEAAEALRELNGDLQEHESGRAGSPVMKYLVALPETKLAEAQAILKTLLRFREQLIEDFPELTDKRPMTAPRVVLNVSHARLNITTAVSVGKTDDGIYDRLEAAILSHVRGREARKQQMAELEALMRLPQERLRYRRNSGMAYQLYIYSDHGDVCQRLNLNNLVVLVGEKDGAQPIIEGRRLRKRRNDADQREIIATFGDVSFYQI